MERQYEPESLDRKSPAGHALYRFKKYTVVKVERVGLLSSNELLQLVVAVRQLRAHLPQRRRVVEELCQIGKCMLSTPA